MVANDVAGRDISLCLSGGGFRAAIFHLGALRWLNEQGVLARLKTVSCVSGGSIIGAHLAYRLRNGWPSRPLDDSQWSDEVVEPFFRVVNRDLRTRPVLARYVLPWNWLRPWSMVEALRRLYASYLFDGDDRPLASFQGLPRFVFCATDMVFSVNWEATWSRVGDYEAGYQSPPPRIWTLSRAVACSSCFPPIFSPAKTRIRAENLSLGGYGRTEREARQRTARVNSIRLTDGGVYDNLGLQPVMADKRVLVSDGGGLFKFALLNLPGRYLARYPALLQNGIGKLRKSWLMRDYTGGTKEGTYWGIGDGSSLGGILPDEEVAELIAGIRTDLNRFTRAEYEILQNHGYLCAAEKTIRKCPQLLSSASAVEFVTPPYPQSWIGRPSFHRALRWSAKRLWPYWLR
jgi:NTE family protein